MRGSRERKSAIFQALRVCFPRRRGGLGSKVEFYMADYIIHESVALAPII